MQLTAISYECYEVFKKPASYTLVSAAYSNIFITSPQATNQHLSSVTVLPSMCEECPGNHFSILIFDLFLTDNYGRDDGKEDETRSNSVKYNEYVKSSNPKKEQTLPTTQTSCVQIKCGKTDFINLIVKALGLTFGLKKKPKLKAGSKVQNIARSLLFRLGNYLVYLSSS